MESSLIADGAFAVFLIAFLALLLKQAVDSGERY